MNRLADVPALCGSLVRLEPLSEDHREELAAAVEEDRSAYGFTSVPRGREMSTFLAAHFERAETGRMAPFAQIRQSDGRAVGCTTYCDPRFWPGRPDLYAVEIGWTWLAASALRTGINVEAKLLLFEHAFETWGVARVDLKTDARNERSRRAIAAAGAQFEGVLRCWSRSHAPGEMGQLRDSAIFSIIASEWPAAKAALRRRLTEHAPAHR
ncbi:MAG TPA: GNAT family protein [Pseudonocardia sp.]|jgi:RimJ/RimL family protein N-acetyltransferase|nr:GNAT family protein [Pseudonocardia sp.]